MKNRKNRRDFLKLGLWGTFGALGFTGVAKAKNGNKVRQKPAQQEYEADTHDHNGLGTVGRVDNDFNRFTPEDLLHGFDYGEVSEMDNGQTLREYEFVAVDREIEIAPGVYFPAWVYGSRTSPESQRLGQIVGRAPGPTLRCVEGDRIRINFINAGSHPHTIHFHGIHSARMDGVPGTGPGMIDPGDSFVYEFDAAEKRKLDALEGLDKGYNEHFVAVPLNGKTYQAYVYVAASTHIDGSLVPYNWYKELVLLGARYHGLPDEYVAKIEAAASILDPDPERAEKNEVILENMRRMNSVKGC